MPLPLDLNLLDSDKKFEQLCFHLAKKEFPKAIPVAHGSRDGGRDAVLFNTEEGDVVWQCKFSQQGLSKLKPKILRSLNALNPAQRIWKWILCALWMAPASSMIGSEIGSNPSSNSSRRGRSGIKRYFYSALINIPMFWRFSFIPFGKRWSPGFAQTNSNLFVIG